MMRFFSKRPESDNGNGQDSSSTPAQNLPAANNGNSSTPSQPSNTGSENTEQRDFRPRSNNYNRPRNPNQNPNRRPQGPSQGSGNMNRDSRPSDARPANPNQNRSRNTPNGPRRFNNSRSPQAGGNNYHRGGPSRPQNSEIFQTANAQNWGSNSEYQYKTDAATDKVRIIPVSGVEVVGVNCTVFEYQDDIMIIDAGSGFPTEDLLGIDSLVPNLSSFYDKLDKIRGLVITHGHADHIGGIMHIIDKIGFPTIYAPRLAAEMIREKAKEYPFANRLNIQEIDGESSYYLGKFKISHFKMNHSIPDNYGVVIDTPVGRIVTPSDYKFDLSPYKGAPCDYSKLTKLGDEGVLMMLAESTNAKKKGWAVSDTEIAKDIESTIRDAEGRILIGMFSTMIDRIRQFIEIADRNGRKVAVLGRSLETNVKIAHKLGYINVLNDVFISFEEVNSIPDNKVLILTTGSQGEPSSALMRMSTDSHQRIKLRKSDTIVFSSQRIPGNEGKIDKLVNLLSEKGCRIITNEYLTVHASGHGCQEDHKLLLEMVKPKFLVPIHGTPSMLLAHKNTAMSLGYAEKDIAIPNDGRVIELWKDGWSFGEVIPTKPLWVEGNRVGDFDIKIIEERKILMDEGIIVVNIKNPESTDFNASNLDLVHKGFFIQNNDDFLNSKLRSSIVDSIVRLTTKDKAAVEQSVRRHIENELMRQYEKKPLVIVSVL